jgi:hypothetical protein
MRLSCLIIVGLTTTLPAPAASIDEMIVKSGISGGIAVFVNIDDPAPAAALGKSDRFLVQMLHKDSTTLTRLRQSLQAGDYGRLSAVQLENGPLPFIDNGVNLIVCGDATAATNAELMRVLTPRGVAFVPNGDDWQTLRKPVPADIDDWTHALYNATNSVVSNDARVGPPRRLQWLAGPGWSRSHEHMISFNAMVSDQGIVYYVVDMGARSSVALPAHWTLFARDAFNGKTLWSKQLPSWSNHMWPLKTGPTQIQRRLVAYGGKVYVPLGATAAVSVIDGISGKVLTTLEGTENC